MNPNIDRQSYTMSKYLLFSSFHPACCSFSFVLSFLFFLLFFLVGLFLFSLFFSFFLSSMLQFFLCSFFSLFFCSFSLVFPFLFLLGFFQIFSRSPPKCLILSVFGRFMDSLPRFKSCHERHVWLKAPN